MMAKATTRSRSQASSVNVSLFAIERATRSGPQDQPRPVSIRSRDIAAIFAASVGRPGLNVMFFAFISGKSYATSMPRLADCRKMGNLPLERLHHGQDDRGGQKRYLHLAEPAAPEAGLGIALPREIGKQLAAGKELADQQDRAPALGLEPPP